jgi:hypothetical protein
MVNPVTSSFWVSWQDDDLLADDDVIGAEAAISWGRERADRVLIRLGHSEGTYFSAGRERVEDLPEWPPSGPPAGGWFTPEGEDR